MVKVNNENEATARIESALYSAGRPLSIEDLIRASGTESRVKTLNLLTKLIQKTNKIDIKPSMIQPVQEIKTLGKYKVKISLHSAVDAEITIDVLSAETIQ